MTQSEPVSVGSVEKSHVPSQYASTIAYAVLIAQTQIRRNRPVLAA